MAHDCGGRDKRAEAEEKLARLVPAVQSCDRAQTRQPDLAFQLAGAREHAHARGRIFQVERGQLSPHRRDPLERVLALGNDLLPILALGFARIDCHSR